MSGFSPEWLALREPADQRARSRDVFAACAAAFKDRADLNICDMGAGTGASVRALAHLLPARQTWTLVDHDAANLTASRDALRAWADRAEMEGDALILHHQGQRIVVSTRVQDFAKAPRCWNEDTHLVTASALFDLASAGWIARFTDALVKERVGLFATLTVDGIMQAVPEHPLDTHVFTRFRDHQTGDKGFGPSAGGEAARLLEEALVARGYHLTAGDSPWILENTDAALIAALIDGIAGAAGETGMAAGQLENWRAARRLDTHRLVIGHRDVFAVPT